MIDFASRSVVLGPVSTLSGCGPLRRVEAASNPLDCRLNWIALLPRFDRCRDSALKEDN